MENDIIDYLRDKIGLAKNWDFKAELLTWLG